MEGACSHQHSSPSVRTSGSRNCVRPSTGTVFLSMHSPKMCQKFLGTQEVSFSRGCTGIPTRNALYVAFDSSSRSRLNVLLHRNSIGIVWCDRGNLTPHASSWSQHSQDSPRLSAPVRPTPGRGSRIQPYFGYIMPFGVPTLWHYKRTCSRSRVSARVFGVATSISQMWMKGPGNCDVVRKSREGVLPLIIDVGSADVMAAFTKTQGEVERKRGTKMRLVFPAPRRRICSRMDR